MNDVDETKNHITKILRAGHVFTTSSLEVIFFSREFQGPSNYAFGYSVNDKHAGEDFSHTEIRDGYTTSGEYRVALPDGRLQIVTYTADENGYHADVKYEGEAILHQPPPLPLPAAPVVAPLPPRHAPVKPLLPPTPLPLRPTPTPLPHHPHPTKTTGNLGFVCKIYPHPSRIEI